MYGETYRTGQDGTFTADFKVSALNDITDVYVFSSTGTGAFPLKNLVSRTTYSGADLSKSRDFTLTANGVQGKQWFALAAVSANNRLAITNPIWVKGPDVSATQKVKEVRPILNAPQVPTVGSVIEQPATAIMTTTPWSGFLFADWALVGGNLNSVAKKNINYLSTLTFTASDGFAFDPSLNDKNAVKVWNDGGQSKLTYRLHLKAKPSR